MACAQIVNPNGGKKDEENPIVILATPKNQTTNFNADEIKIEFNEYIDLKSPEKVIISPPVKEKITLQFKGKELLISLKKIDLDSNSTYSINLSGSTTDIHEGLPLTNYTYSFTKSNHLDSDSIVGYTKDAWTKKPIKDLVVGLYDTLGFHDSIPFKFSPKYYSVTNDSGYFVIHNLPSKNFMIFSFNDQNKNLKYDNNEDFGFIENAIQIGGHIEKNMNINKPDLFSRNKILEANKIGSNTYAIVVYEPKKIVLETKIVKNSKSNYFLKEGFNQIDTFLYSFEQANSDSLVELIVMKDSQHIDTLEINNFKKVKNKKPSITCHSVIRNDDSINLILNTPCKQIDKSKIKVSFDSTDIAFEVYDKTPLLKQLNFKKEEAKLYKITLKDSALISFDNEYSLSKTLEVKTYSSNQTGEVKLNVVNTKNIPCIISIVSNNEKEEELLSLNNSNTETYTLKYFNPGEYKVKLIIDVNKNGKWDKGHWFHKSNPEPIYYYPEVIGVRILWEIEQTISIDQAINNLK